MLRPKLLRPILLSAMVGAYIFACSAPALYAIDPTREASDAQNAQESSASVSGTIIHNLETPADVAGNPSMATISNYGISRAVSFGNNMGGADNFSMVVSSEEVADTRVIGRMAIQWGKARSVTIENGDIVESAVYDYVVMVRDENDSDGADHWSMSLWGDELMFDGVTFSGAVTAGDLVVQPQPE